MLLFEWLMSHRNQRWKCSRLFFPSFAIKCHHCFIIVSWFPVFRAKHFNFTLLGEWIQEGNSNLKNRSLILQKILPLVQIGFTFLYFYILTCHITYFCDYCTSTVASTIETEFMCDLGNVIQTIDIQCCITCPGIFSAVIDLYVCFIYFSP